MASLQQKKWFGSEDQRLKDEWEVKGFCWEFLLLLGHCLNGTAGGTLT